MKIDEVKGGIKAFNGDQENSEDQSNTSNGVAGTRTRSKRGQAGGALTAAGKRKTWKSDTSEGFEKNPIQISKAKTEPLKNSDQQSSGKRSHKYASSGNYGGAGEEESLQQLSVKAASLSFSNVSVRKKMKPNGPKIWPPKSSKSSEPVKEDIEIEIAEVLGLMKQSKSSKDQDNIKNSTLNLEAKDRNVTELKDKKVEAGSGSMAVQDSSVSEAGVFEKSDQPEKFETCSPKSNGELCNPVHHMGCDEGAFGSIES